MPYVYNRNTVLMFHLVISAQNGPAVANVGYVEKMMILSIVKYQKKI